MTTKGWLISGLAGVALLFGCGLLVVTWTDGGAPVRPGGSASDTPVPATAQPAAPAPTPAPAAPSPRPAAPVPAPGPELPTSVPERLRALEPLRREVYAGLAELDGRVEACHLRDAALVLTLETIDRGVRILEVQVSPAGAATAEVTGVAPLPLDEGAVRCVRGALERTVLQAPSAVAGRQWELSYAPGTKP